ncbi:MAG TPA: hypothetical protein VJK48_02905 [Chlamydiales bacterium]|nr:MAG: hypothetical protein A3F67_10325 [Verrucomicrobia bacterium RIFCSPHIGHO2_12_FULL_41_10]HLB52643.1 hypothetical protein [Chlamydiales bacterium]
MNPIQKILVPPIPTQPLFLPPVQHWELLQNILVQYIKLFSTLEQWEQAEHPKEGERRFTQMGEAQKAIVQPVLEKLTSYLSTFSSIEGSNASSQQENRHVEKGEIVSLSTKKNLPETQIFQAASLNLFFSEGKRDEFLPFLKKKDRDLVMIEKSRLTLPQALLTANLILNRGECVFAPSYFPGAVPQPLLFKKRKRKRDYFSFKNREEDEDNKTES